jgi:hypothetical protein
MTIKVFSDGGNTIVQLGENTLDSDGASRLRNLLRTMLAEAEQPIVVDMSRAREVTPIALAALIDDFEQLRSVRFRGLSRHASRVLAHLAQR